MSHNNFNPYVGPLPPPGGGAWAGQGPYQQSPPPNGERQHSPAFGRPLVPSRQPGQEYEMQPHGYQDYVPSHQHGRSDSIDSRTRLNPPVNGNQLAVNTGGVDYPPTWQTVNTGGVDYPPTWQTGGYPPPSPAGGTFNRIRQHLPFQQHWPESPSSLVRSGTQNWHKLRDNLIKHRDVKQIPLFNNNVVIDVPVPAKVCPQPLPPGQEKGEMEQLRYSAATCDPDDFMESGFRLRQYLYDKQRTTELFIVMTMYNEGSDLLLRTLNSVLKNIDYLTQRDKSTTWGPGSWKKVVVCIVADGRKPCHPRVLKVLQLMGIYAEGVAKDTVTARDKEGRLVNKEVQAHIFEYTSDIKVTDDGEVSHTGLPVQFIFCLKEQNKKKINSHRWFFNAFGPLVKPNVCVLLDVGTKPSTTSIYELYKVFQKHENVGGACGEIYAETGKLGRLLFNPLVAGQNFEYKMSNILDKPFESVFGFISVLPGAFSAYRYEAVANTHPAQKDSKTGQVIKAAEGPLASYFHGEHMNQPGAPPAGIMERNMFLAEDRILAYEIVTKKNARWRLQYVKSAKASTDVPTRVPEFISQRRRWLNGSIFASAHALIRFYRIWTSGHNIFRKLFLQILVLYNLISLLFNVLSLSSYYLAFFFLVSNSVAGTVDPFGGAGDEIFAVFNKVYIAVIVLVIVCSLGNRPQGSKFWYTACILLFACCQLILLWCAGFTVYQTVPHTAEGWRDVSGLMSNPTFLALAMSLLATYGLYLISSLMYLDPWHMLTSFFQYLLLLPSYVNILLIYAFCNLHDVSWGTKGDNGAAKDLGAAVLKTKDGQDVVEVQMPTRQQDVEELWQQARKELSIPWEEKDAKRDQTTKRSDSDRNFRTNVLILFLGINMALIYIFTAPFFTEWVSKNFANQESGSFNPYLTFIFYCVLGLSGLRFIGCTLYLILHVFGF